MSEEPEKKKQDPISKKLGIVPWEESKSNLPSKIIDADIDNPVDNLDQQYAQDQIKTAIEQGQKAVAELMDIAPQTQNPSRAYEVVADLIRSVIDGSQKLVDTNLKVKQAKEDNESKKTVNHNYLVVGSTDELLEVVQRTRKKNG